MPRQTNRRRSLQLLGAVAAVTLAGCSGGTAGDVRMGSAGSKNQYGIVAHNQTDETLGVTISVGYPLGETPTDTTDVGPVFERSVELAPDEQETWTDVIPEPGKFVVEAELQYENPFAQSRLGSDALRVDAEEGRPEPGTMRVLLLPGTRHPVSRNWDLSDNEPVYGVELLAPDDQLTETW